MKSPKWVATTRQLIKSNHGFGWSVLGIEKQNKVKTKVVYRLSTRQRTTVLTDLDWHAENNNVIEEIDLLIKNLIKVLYYF